jgi:hypothetical protein
MAEAAHRKTGRSDAVNYLSDAAPGDTGASTVRGSPPCDHDDVNLAYRLVERLSPPGADRIGVTRCRRAGRITPTTG